MKILKCNCDHEYQDRKYGNGMRAHNPQKTVPVKYRCTVCGKEDK